MADRGKQLKDTFDNLTKVNEGLKDQISYENELNKLYADRAKFSDRQFKSVTDVLDKTKDIFTNRKNLTEEQLTQVDLHKLERKLIAEGLQDHIQIVQKLKEEDRIQRRINNTINQSAKSYENIGNSVDNLIKKIPGVGGLLSTALGTDELGKDMSEAFRTSLQSQGGFFEFGRNAGGEFAGGLGVSLLQRGTVSKSADIIRASLLGLGTAAAAFATGKLFSEGLKDGAKSLDVGNTLKRTIFGSAFSGMKDAFGSIRESDVGSLFSLRLQSLAFGIDPANQAKILAAQVNISGASKQTALEIQKGLASSAALRGVLPADVFQDIANNTEQFATFAKDGGQNIGEAAIRARELGVSLDTVFKISDSVLDFQSSIENELKASLLIGRQLNLNRARELAMMGDMAGLQDEIVRQVGNEADLQRMNVIQRKSLAGALGITVSELNRLASGELEVKNSEMKQNTSAMVQLTIAMGILTTVLGLTVARSLYSGIRNRVMGGASVIGTGSGSRPFRIMGADGEVVKGTGAYKYAKNASKAAAMRGISLRGATRATIMGMTSGTLLGGFGVLAAGLATIIPIIMAIRKSSDKTSENTGRSIPNALNTKLFTTELGAENPGTT